MDLYILAHSGVHGRADTYRLTVELEDAGERTFDKFQDFPQPASIYETSDAARIFCSRLQNMPRTFNHD